jgi:carboxypeptidase C (cathepsin A)
VDVSDKRPADDASKQDGKQEAPKRRPLTQRDPVTTSHSIRIGRQSLDYDVTFGALPLTDEYGEVEAHVYFTAYVKQGGDKSRPLTFTYNGGPGSSSAWLHLGGLSPKRVDLDDMGDTKAPPHRLVDNTETWLQFTDMVFIDPVGTGFSQGATPDLDKKFWGVEGDLESVAEVIRLYLGRYGRWTSPIFLAGESYGTFRSAGLASLLFDRGIAINGIVLISTILNMQTARFTAGNDLPYATFFPTYTTSAWYHGKLPKDLQNRKLEDLVTEVEEWVDREYVPALHKGDLLQGKERERMIQQVARYSGLTEDYVERANLRINIMRFCKELLRDRKQTIGRIDSRFTARDLSHVTEYPEFDPSVTFPGPVYTSTYNAYIRDELGWETDIEFEMMSGEVNKHWEWGGAAAGYPDTSERLRSAMHKFRHLKVLVQQGYYDFATPHYAAEYTFRHMGIAPEYQDNVEWAYYEAGHMMYIDRKCREKMYADTVAFYERALKR